MTLQASTPGALNDVELAIGGMTCASCAARIEKKLNKLDGVTATVNYATEKAQVRAPDGVDTEVLAAELEDTFGTPYLAEAYLRWRRMKRKSEGDTTHWPRLSEIEMLAKYGQAPVGAFARAVSGSVEKFCAQFCIQAPTLTRYIEGRSGEKELPYFEPPASVREALTDAGYDHLDELFEMQRMWRDAHEGR